MFRRIITALTAFLRRASTPTRPSERSRVRAARAAAHEAAALTGWGFEGLLAQTLEDTCTAHATFACARCFA